MVMRCEMRGDENLRGSGSSEPTVIPYTVLNKKNTNEDQLYPVQKDTWCDSINNKTSVKMARTEKKYFIFFQQ